MIPVAGSVFGQGRGEDTQGGQRPAQPQRAGGGELDFHQDPVVGQQGRAAAAKAQVQLPGAPADVGVEGDPQLRIVDARQRGALIGEKDLRLRPVHLLEPENLPADLPGGVIGHQIVEKRLGQTGLQTDAALVDHAPVLLFQLREHRVPFAGGAVAAKPQLFLINRLLQRGADQPVVRRVVIETGNRIPAVFVGPAMLLQDLRQVLLLGGGEEILLLVTGKGVGTDFSIAMPPFWPSIYTASLKGT